MVTAGILLAGGMSRRFGSAKAFAKLENKYFYQWVYSALDKVCDMVVIVTLEQLLPQFSSHLHVITDDSAYQGKGPLAGIYSGMMALPADRYVVVPCDMPYISGEGLMALLNATATTSALVSAVSLHSKQHPLVSCWKPEMQLAIKNSLDNWQYRVTDLLTAAGAMWIEGNLLSHNAAEMLQNFNCPEQVNNPRLKKSKACKSHN